jgi:hypothetical protein
MPRRVPHNHGTMTSEIDKFIHDWVHDVEMILKRRLENLKEDLRSDDEDMSIAAAEETGEILNWLYPPLPPLASDAKLQAAKQALDDERLGDEQKLVAARRAMRSTGRPRGRPRSETSQHAIQALSLRSATAMSWREIALRLKGCNHKRPKPERSCVPCGEAIREAAERLRRVLIHYSLIPSERDADNLVTSIATKLNRSSRGKAYQKQT